MKFPSWKVVPPQPWLQETICNGDLQVGDISNILNISWLVPREMYEMTISRPLSIIYWVNCHVNALSRQHIIPFLTASSALPRSSRKLSCAHAYLCIRRGRKRERKKVKSPSELQVRDVNWRWRRTTWFQRKTALAVSSGSGSGFARKTLNKIWLSAKYTAKLLPPKVAVPRICFTTWNAIHYKTKNASNAACPPSPPTLHEKSKEPALKQMTLASSFANSVPYDKISPKWKEFTTAVTKYVTKDTVPVSVVEKPGFKNLIKTLKVWFAWLQFFFRKSATRVVHVGKRKGGPPANKYDPLLHNYASVVQQNLWALSQLNSTLHRQLGVEKFVPSNKLFSWWSYRRAHCTRAARCSHVMELVRNSSSVHHHR